MFRKSFIAFILVLVLMWTLGTSCALAIPEDWVGRTLSDFSVTTISGETFQLSDILKTHELVLLNFWATWCGPCRMEFPALEAAWEQYADRVYVIALSVESTDTFDVLRSFANENQLSFAIGRDATNMFDKIGGSAIPTTLIVNREMRVLAVEIGAKTSAGEFTSLFDSFLSAYPSTSSNAYRCVLHFCDVYGNPIPGVTVGFCNGEYTPIETDGSGCVQFDGALNDYHVHLLEVPYGYVKPWDEMYIYGDSYDLTVTLYPI